MTSLYERLLRCEVVFALMWCASTTSLSAAEVKWHASLPEARTIARRTGVPLLVRIGSESCPYCRVLEKTMSSDAVAAELEKWTLVDLRLETSSDEIEPLAVGPIPALRVLMPSGRIVAAHEGAVPEDELLAWLRAAREEVAVSMKADELLAEDGELDAARAMQIVALFGRREPAVREGALRRLRPHPSASAVAVVVAFQEGSLATRLTAIDLLEVWRAPLEDIDPWQPASITRAKLDTLAEWAAARATSTEQVPESGPDRRSMREILARYLTAPEEEAGAIRERLARFGRLLLPQIYESLRTVENDRVRERLTHLRYRLVATDQLALQWTGGLERLSASNADVRQQAAVELAARATSADEQLLLELFSDPAPLIREIALKALHRTGASETASTLLRLLDDPDPNVQAAVLNQLAESPTAEIVPRLAAYVTKEQSPDLIGHAVRVLGAAPGPLATETLTALLDHADWHVRAAAVESLGKKVEHSSSSNSTNAEATADINVAILERLKDDDGFVVGQAVQVFAKLDLPIAVGPLVEAAQKHPELAGEVVKALANGSNSQTKAMPHVIEFTRHPLPAVRAAATAVLSQYPLDEIEPELARLLKDNDAAPRIAAAQTLLQILIQQLGERPHTATSYQPPRTSAQDDSPVSALSPLNANIASTPATVAANQNLLNGVLNFFQNPVAQPSPPPDDVVADYRDPELFLTQIRAGRLFPKWAFALTPSLEAMLSAESAEERVAAAVTLAALGKDAVSLPVLTKEAPEAPLLTVSIAGALPWLRWPEREALFQLLVGRTKDPETLAEIAGALHLARDARASPLLWSLLQRPETDARLAAALHGQFLLHYIEEPYSSSFNNVTATQRRFLVQDASAHATFEARHWERMEALSLLMAADVDRALELATALSERELPAAEQAALLRIRLLGEGNVAGRRTAIAALTSSPVESQTVAVRFLALGGAGIHELDGLTLSNSTSSTHASSNEPWDPSPPIGLSAEMLLPLLSSPDPQTRYCVQYLRALLGAEDALPPMVEFWKQQSEPDHQLTQLLFRAIAALDASEQISVLDSIYKSMQSEDTRYYLGDFYWTIRIMTGPDALALRKKIRDEVGMANLR